VRRLFWPIVIGLLVIWFLPLPYAGYDHDEGLWGLGPRNWAQEGSWTAGGSRHIYLSPVYAWVVGLVYKYAGVSYVHSRVAVVLAAWLAATVVFLVLRRRGFETAAIGALLFLTAINLYAQVVHGHVEGFGVLGGALVGAAALGYSLLGALGLGAAAGFAVSCKATLLPVVASAMMANFVGRIVRARQAWWRAGASVVIAALVMAVIAMAAYGYFYAACPKVGGRTLAGHVKGESGGTPLLSASKVFNPYYGGLLTAVSGWRLGDTGGFDSSQPETASGCALPTAQGRECSYEAR